MSKVTVTVKVKIPGSKMAVELTKDEALELVSQIKAAFDVPAERVTVIERERYPRPYWPPLVQWGATDNTIPSFTTDYSVATMRADNVINGDFGGTG